MMYVVFAVLLVAAAYLWMASPHFGRNWNRLEMRALFAHRGFHDLSNGVPENTLPAFARAVERGYGIELDVHITKDDQLIVFHDDDFSRAAGDPKDPREMTLAEIRALTLFGTDERVPTLDEVLSLVNGKVPLLVELKSCKRHARLSKLAVDRLRAYDGPYLFESFSPLLVREAGLYAPRCGQLVTHMDWKKGAVPRPLKLVLSLLMLNFYARPDFIAFNHTMDKSLVIRLMRGLFYAPTAVWTIKTPEQFARFKDRADMIIFEGFEPSGWRSSPSESPSGTSSR